MVQTTLLCPTAISVDVGFEQFDFAVEEGRDSRFFLRKYNNVAQYNITVRVLPLTVGEFEVYRANNSGRNFSQEDLNRVADISDPAESK